MRQAPGALVVAALLLGGQPALAQDSAAGARLFASCTACHSLDAAAPGMAGPHLAELKGRVLGSAAGFDYSPAFKAARAAGLAWDAERLKAYLADPDAVVPGGWMSPPAGLSETDRAAIATFLLGG
ncbi:c-type cytochrome [Bosea sp. (in: a-proteobacteria)]|uniref:c-type cytochrome n=1 Tax=Bosea sp. (in: a-proteobacteria) TaxID=1871050 RepID=UPI003F7209F8